MHRRMASSSNLSGRPPPPQASGRFVCVWRCLWALYRHIWGLQRASFVIFACLIAYTVLHGMLITFPHHKHLPLHNTALTRLTKVTKARPSPGAQAPDDIEMLHRQAVPPPPHPVADLGSWTAFPAASTHPSPTPSPRPSPPPPALTAHTDPAPLRPPRPELRQPRPRRPMSTAGAVLCGALGVAAAVGLSGLGASYGMAKAGLGLVHMCRLAPQVHLRGLLPVVMAELLAVYGFIFGLSVVGTMDIRTYTPFAGFLDLAGGLVVGFSSLASGFSLGLIGDANNRAYGLQYRHLEDSLMPPKGNSALPSPLLPGAALPVSTDDFDGSGPANARAANVTAARVAASRSFAAMMLMLIFAEGIGLYGLIAAFLLHSTAVSGTGAQPATVASAAWQGSGVQGQSGCQQDASAALFGGLGAAAAVGFAVCGAGYGIARAGTGVCHLGVRNWARTLRGTTPVVMSELLAIYGFVASLAMVLGLDSKKYSTFSGYVDFSAGTAVGLGCLSAGFAIGTIGDACVRTYAKQHRIFVAMVLMLVFAEALGLCSLIAGIIMHGVATEGYCAA